MVTLFFHALLILSVFGGVVFTAVSVRPGTDAPRLWLAVATVGLGFALAVAWIRTPEPVIASGLVSLVAAIQLARPKYVLLAAACGGALAGLSASLLQVYGIAAPAAVVMAAAAPAAAAELSFKVRDFAPDDMREQALLGLLLFSILCAVAPGLLAGWQSALSLNMGARNATAYAMPGWTLSLGAVSLALGGAWAVWRRQ